MSLREGDGHPRFIVTVALLVLHSIAAVLLLGAVTHQAIALWWPPRQLGSGFARSLRAVHPERYARAIVVLFAIVVGLGSVAYVPFRSVTRALYLDVHAPWATGLFEIKEHAAAIGLALLPLYWAVWRAAEAGERTGRRAVTSLLAIITWWNFIVGHVVNNVRGL